MKKAYSILILTFAVLILTDFVSCSPVQFAKEQPPAQNSGPNIVNPVSCSNGLCLQHHQDTITSGPAKADILFIVDNGGSVSDVQASIASRFSSFIQGLSGIDYRIAITTTDVSSLASDTPGNFPSAVNSNGALQDGKLIQFSTGDFFITSQTPNPQGVFGSNIQRPETANCVASNYQDSQCPSQDPRAIYAANLFVGANYNAFLRANVPTTFVIISDDDERNTQDLAPYGYPQGSNDLPSTLVSNFASHFPSNTLTVSALVIKPGDSACYNARNGRNGNPNLFGHYANIYAQLVNQTAGVLGSICAPDYAAELGAIAAAIPAAEQVSSFKLACQPYNSAYQLQFTNKNDGSAAASIPATLDPNQPTIHLSSPIPANVNVVVSYDCQV